ncbi:hypothetical protein DMA12_20780 [Amycolatopsis balhimycina DSM 5908]|uniref:Uncharacterized protein n=1 Tax=Amycolatopsis balhimycina DSM 5908 TaxID=1081091 RepID=A0A428WHX4_AMYBA|nr:hypothetical protein DMA12_20780 [Amycolatopsis balhimycina DSM 5908]
MPPRAVGGGQGAVGGRVGAGVVVPDDHPSVAEIATLRNLVLHVGARITRGARQVRVRIDETCTHAPAIAVNARRDGRGRGRSAPRRPNAGTAHQMVWTHAQDLRSCSLDQGPRTHTGCLTPV